MLFVFRNELPHWRIPEPPLLTVVLFKYVCTLQQTYTVCSCMITPLCTDGGIVNIWHRLVITGKHAFLNRCFGIVVYAVCIKCSEMAACSTFCSNVALCMECLVTWSFLGVGHQWWCPIKVLTVRWHSDSVWTEIPPVVFWSMQLSFSPVICLPLWLSLAQCKSKIYFLAIYTVKWLNLWLLYIIISLLLVDNTLLIEVVRLMLVAGAIQIWVKLIVKSCCF